MSEKIYRLDKLVVPARMGFMNYNDIHFHLTRDCDPVSWPWGESPAANKITSTLRGDWSGLTVFTREGTPEEYLDIIVAHEVIEGNEKWYKGTPHSDAYNMAVDFHMDYAKKFKDEKTFGEFLEWQEQFQHYKDKGFSAKYQSGAK